MPNLSRSDRWAIASLCATGCLGFAAWAFPNMTRYFTVPAAFVCGSLAIYFGWLEISAAAHFAFARKRIHFTAGNYGDACINFQFAASRLSVSRLSVSRLSDSPAPSAS